MSPYDNRKQYFIFYFSILYTQFYSTPIRGSFFFYLCVQTKNMGDNYLLSPPTISRLQLWHNDTHFLALIPFILTNNNILRACIVAYVLLDTVDIRCDAPVTIWREKLNECSTKGYVFIIRTCVIIGLLVTLLTDIHYKAANTTTAYFAYAMISLPLLSEIISYFAWHGSTWAYMSQQNYGKNILTFSENYNGFFWHGLGHVGIWIGLILILLMNKKMSI